MLSRRADGARETLTSSSDHPDGALRLRHNAAAGVDVDLRALVQVVVGRPDPEAFEVRARLRREVESQEGSEAVVAASAGRRAVVCLEIRASLCRRCHRKHWASV